IPGGPRQTRRCRRPPNAPSIARLTAEGGAGDSPYDRQLVSSGAVRRRRGGRCAERARLLTPASPAASTATAPWAPIVAGRANLEFLAGRPALFPDSLDSAR